MSVFIDANNYLKRAYHGGGDPYSLWKNLLDQYASESVYVVCDTPESREYRRSIFPSYKKGRKQDDDPIYWELYNNCKSMAQYYDNVSLVEVIDGEADDFIHNSAKTGDTVISNDKDLWPLHGKGIKILVNATSLVDNDLIKMKFEFPQPEFILVYKALVGDPSDNIKGKFRFGKKSYSKLTEAEIRDILDCLENDKPHDLIDESVKTSYRLAKPYKNIKIRTLAKLPSNELMTFINKKGIVC